jgi:hypothetical protein
MTEIDRLESNRFKTTLALAFSWTLAVSAVALAFHRHRVAESGIAWSVVGFLFPEYYLTFAGTRTFIENRQHIGQVMSKLLVK